MLINPNITPEQLKELIAMQQQKTAAAMNKEKVRQGLQKRQQAAMQKTQHPVLEKAPAQTGSPVSTPTDPLAAKAGRVAAAQQAGKTAGVNNGVELNDTNIDKSNESRTESMPSVMPGYMLGPRPDDLVEEMDPHATARARKQFGEGHPEVPRETVTNSLARLKAGLSAWKEAQSGASQQSELRAQLAPFLAGKGSMTPFLSAINSITGSKLQDAPDSVPEKAMMAAKLMSEDQTDREQLAALEDKMLDHVIFPQGQKWIIGNSNEKKTEEGVKAVTQPPRAAGKGLTYDKDVRDLGKYLRTWAPSASTDLATMDKLLSKSGGLKGALGSANPNIPGTGTIESMMPRNWLSAEGSRMRAALTSLARQRLQLRSGQAASEKETNAYLEDMGITWKAGPRESANGIRRVLQEFSSTIDAAYAGYPEEAVRIYRGRPGAVKPEDFTKYVPSEEADQSLPPSRDVGPNGGVGPHGNRLRQNNQIWIWNPATGKYDKEKK